MALMPPTSQPTSQPASRQPVPPEDSTFAPSAAFAMQELANAGDDMRGSEAAQILRGQDPNPIYRASTKRLVDDLHVRYAGKQLAREEVAARFYDALSSSPMTAAGINTALQAYGQQMSLPDDSLAAARALAAWDQEQWVARTTRELEANQKLEQSGLDSIGLAYHLGRLVPNDPSFGSTVQRTLIAEINKGLQNLPPDVRARRVLASAALQTEMLRSQDQAAIESGQSRLDLANQKISEIESYLRKLEREQAALSSIFGLNASPEQMKAASAKYRAEIGGQSNAANKVAAFAKAYGTPQVGLLFETLRNTPPGEAHKAIKTLIEQGKIDQSHVYGALEGLLQLAPVLEEKGVMKANDAAAAEAVISTLHKNPLFETPGLVPLTSSLAAFMGVGPMVPDQIIRSATRRRPGDRARLMYYTKALTEFGKKAYPQFEAVERPSFQRTLRYIGDAKVLMASMMARSNYDTERIWRDVEPFADRSARARRSFNELMGVPA